MPSNVVTLQLKDYEATVLSDALCRHVEYLQRSGRDRLAMEIAAALVNQIEGGGNTTESVEKQPEEEQPSSLPGGVSELASGKGHPGAF